MMNKNLVAAIATVCFVVFFSIKTHENNVVINNLNGVSGSSAALSNVELQYAPLKDKIICIDAGHGVTSLHKYEPIAPEAAEKKPAYVSGTAGRTMTEEQLNLFVALKLEQKLVGAGAKVLMTRRAHECELSNIDRAKFANDAKANLTIRIHADGSENKEINGISMLIPSDEYISDADMLGKSRKAGEAVLNGALAATGAYDRGIVERPDMTGFNWSTVPVILIEMGFMTNPEEDILLSSDEYQNKIVNGIMNGLNNYFSNMEEESL